MFDLGWAELLVIGVVALIVVGPKDLPKLFRTLGQFTGKARRMAREFTSAMNAAADEAGVKDLKDIGGDIRKATSPRAMGLDGLEKAANAFDKWDPNSATGRLSKERAEAAQKIRDAAAKKAEERMARERAEAQAAAEAAAEAETAGWDDEGAVASPPPRPAAAAPAETRPETPPKKADPA